MALPKNTWAHGEYPTAVEMNKFSDSLEAIHDVLGDVARNYAVPADVSSAVFYLIHRYKYLWFGSVGLIVDPAAIGDDVSISEVAGPGNATKYDLDSVSWLVYGALYSVTGVSFCGESEA